MDYLNGIQMIGDKTTVRFVLANRGTHPLYVLGLNPSTADDSNTDPTMRSVMRLAEYNGYDSFVMLNLYPFRTPKPYMLPTEADAELHQQNLEHIREVLKEVSGPDVLLAYGKNVSMRSYLRNCRNDILAILKEVAANIYIIDYNKDGTPKHPLYCSSKPFIRIEDIQQLL